MLNKDLIYDTISELEDGDTTISNCQKLASLYIISEHFKKEPIDNVEHELSDILPQYKKYIDAKLNYQKGNTDVTYVDNAMSQLCKEIKEFIQILYKTTESKAEREMLNSTVYEMYITLK